MRVGDPHLPAEPESERPPVRLTAPLDGEPTAIVVLTPNPAAPGSGPRPLASGEALTAVVEHAYCCNFETAKRDLASDYLRLLAGVPVVEIGRPRGFNGLEIFLDVIDGLMTAGLS